MVTASREKGESRQFGALGVIFDEQTEKVLVLAEKVSPAKKGELAAWVQPQDWFQNGGLVAYNFPGGGRGKQADGKDETLYRVLVSEMEEEALTGVSKLPWGRTKTLKQKTPLVVAQEVHHQQKELHHIDQFAVTSALFFLDEMSKKAKQAVDTIVDAGQAHWVLLKSLYWLSTQSNTRERISFTTNGRIEKGEGSVLPRPQLLALAKMWYFQSLKEVPTLPEMIRSANAQAIATIHSYAEAQNLQIRNGAFDLQGNLLPLSARDREFLVEPIRTRT